MTGILQLNYLYQNIIFHALKGPFRMGQIAPIEEGIIIVTELFKNCSQIIRTETTSRRNRISKKRKQDWSMKEVTRGVVADIKIQHPRQECIVVICLRSEASSEEIQTEISKQIHKENAQIEIQKTLRTTLSMAEKNLRQLKDMMVEKDRRLATSEKRIRQLKELADDRKTRLADSHKQIQRLKTEAIENGRRLSNSEKEVQQLKDTIVEKDKLLAYDRARISRLLISIVKQMKLLDTSEESLRQLQGATAEKDRHLTNLEEEIGQLQVLKQLDCEKRAREQEKEPCRLQITTQKHDIEELKERLEQEMQILRDRDAIDEERQQREREDEERQMQLICGICLETMGEPRTIVQPAPEITSLPCGHVFDEPCIQEWLYHNNTCPMCRRRGC